MTNNMKVRDDIPIGNPMRVTRLTGALFVALLLSHRARAATTDSNIKNSSSTPHISITVLPETPATLPPRNSPDVNHTRPLDKHVTVRLIKVPIHGFLEDISRQSNLKFNFAGDLGACSVTVLLHDVTAREALQVLLSIHGMTYQQLGRTDTYTIAMRPGHLVCPRFPPAKPASGFCKSTQGAPISLQCEDGPVAKFAELVFEQSSANLVFVTGAEDYPLTANLREATPTEALEVLLSDKTLTLNQVGGSAIYSISVRNVDRVR